ncbi:MAG: hypothetical protein EXR70_18355 [Deltaproteobacteria bacterium]|nr:hypothetical protein [Deltaproteobacteria bacterium]
MTRRIFAILFALCLAPLTSGNSQELGLDKILNPLPEFDPFEKANSAPQFFPDDTDKRARELLIDALTGNKDGLAPHLKALQSEDAKLQKQHGTVTGLAEHAQDLLNNTIADRERYIAAQKDAINNSTTPARKKYLAAIVDRDDLNQSDQLMRQSSTNFFGGLANRLLSSIDLVGVASGNFIGAAAETAVSQLYALMDKDMPAEERRALARDLDHLKRFPDDPRNAAIVKQVEALDKKKKAALAAKQIVNANQALAKGDFPRAQFHADLASLLEPASKDAENIRQQAEKALSQLDAARKPALTAKVETNASAEQKAQQADIARLLQALSLRDSNQIQRVAVELDRKYRGKPLADAARDAEAVGLEIKGWHEAAKKAVAEIAKSTVNPELKQRANALLQSPEYNLLTPFNDARSERQLESMKYVLLGENFLRKNLLFAAGAMAAAGPGAVATLGMANAVMVGTNFYQVMTNNPISAQPVIDAGVAYVRSHPNSDNAGEVYKILADAFEERGLYDKAIGYHELANSPKEKIAALQDKAAKALLNAATKSGERGAREYYLTSIIDQHPESASAAEATKKLAELAKEENQGMRMSKQFLLEHPELYGPHGLGLKASLFDGNPNNMEIAERGVNLISDNEMLVYYQTPWGVRSQNYPLAKSVSARFFVTLREKNLQVAMADVNQRARDSVGGIKNLPGAIVRAERERRGANREVRAEDNSMLSLVREAGPAGYAKVLDAQMLSDNERDPGSKYQMPPVSGSISASRFSLSGGLPTGLWGNQLAIGSDRGGAFAGVQLPIPLLEGFIPVDFMVQGRPGGISIYPRLRTSAEAGAGADPELYR